MLQRSAIKKNQIKCSVCKSMTSLYRVERDEMKKRIYICSKHPKKEVKMKSETLVDVDQKFYNYIWSKRPHYCEECGKELKTCIPDYFHHILPKRKGAGGYPYFRHEEKNVLLLCGRYGCHGKAESATSYPKMKIFERAEKIKKQLLESVGITYESKIVHDF